MLSSTLRVQPLNAADPDLRLREAEAGGGESSFVVKGAFVLGSGALHRGSRPLPGPGAPGSFSETPSLHVGVQQGSGGGVLTSPKLAFQCH